MKSGKDWTPYQPYYWKVFSFSFCDSINFMVKIYAVKNEDFLLVYLNFLLL